MADSAHDSKNDSDEEIKLLFVANEDKYLLATFAFLDKRGWTYKFVTSMKEAFGEIAVYRPTHVLVSWNLPGTNVPKAEKAITRGFKVPCIVFTEKELDPKKQHALAASGVKNYLIAPISGTSVHVKIRALIHDKLTGADDPNIQKKMKAILVKGEGSNVFNDEKITIKIGLEDEIKSILAYMPKEGEWEQNGVDADGTPLWRLKKKGGDPNDKHFFVFKGEAPPKGKDGRWEIPEGGGSFKQVEPGYKNNSNRRVELRQMVTYDENGVLVENKFEMQTTMSKAVKSMGTAKKLLKPKAVKLQVQLKAVSPAEKKRMVLYMPPPAQATVDKLKVKIHSDQVEIIKQQQREDAASFAASQKAAPVGSIRIEAVAKGEGAKINKAVIFKGARMNQNIKSAADQISGKGTAKASHQMFAGDKKDKPKIQNMMKQLQNERVQLSKPKGAEQSQPKSKQNNKTKIEARKPQGVAKGIKVSGSPLGAKANVKAGNSKTEKPTHKQFGGAKVDPNKAKVFSGNKQQKAQLIAQDKVKMKKGQIVAQDKLKMKQGSKIRAGLMEGKKKSSIRYLPKKNAEEVKKSAEKIKVELKTGKAAITMAEAPPKKNRLAAYKPRVQEKIERVSKVPAVKIEKLPPKLKANSPLTAPKREQPQKVGIKKEKVKIERQKPVKKEKPQKPVLNRDQVKKQHKEKIKQEREAKVQELRGPFSEKTKLLGKKKDSMLAARVARAFDNIATEPEHTKDVVRVPLKMVTHVDCIPINSKGFSGLLIFATSAPKHCGPMFSRQIKDEMFKLMNSGGEKMKDEGELELVVQPFDFVAVAAEIGDFVTITEHDGVELGTAFIPCSGVIPELGESNAQNMIEVALDKIKPGEKLKFDAYIHMPLNQKYIRYVKEGGTLEESQLKNMTDFKVTQIYVKSNEVRTVKSHFASSFVEKVIQDFINAVKKSA